MVFGLVESAHSSLLQFQLVMLEGLPQRAAATSAHASLPGYRPCCFKFHSSSGGEESRGCRAVVGSRYGSGCQIVTLMLVHTFPSGQSVLLIL